MLNALKGRFFLKLAVLVVAVALPVGFAMLAVRGFVVRNAVVTAELGIVRAPIAGQIVGGSPSAEQVTEDHVRQVTVRDPLINRLAIDALAAEIDNVARTIDVQQANLQWHDQTIAEQEDELQSALSGMRQVLQHEFDTVSADMTAQRARITYLDAQNERLRRLQGTAASQATLEATAADLEQARANLESLQSSAMRIEQQRSLISQRLPVADFGGLGATLIEHLNELAIARQAIAMRLADLDSAQAELQARLESEQRAYDLLSQAVLEAPPSSVVWEIFAEPGAFVARGSPLFSFVDCDRRLVQVAVDDSTTELITPGHPVEVHLYGDRTPIAGSVRAIYGSGGQATQRGSLAAHVADIGPREAVVFIDIGPADERSRQYRHCDIGRTAYVEFQGIGAFEPFFNRF